ncbi:DUF4365 domain-containing protein [Rubinisphaera italica]|uniref:DUF4365 domain-containing protein n=1 Tax=Rubinisphaera italica TaxID=2527969 RepID=A0A5C5XKF2_9PLAN|nr:DUF4365 domain-containing protein [Rubinisphaera italica]TWT62853.1 hypothetical protein Pan54_35990 [Rubinisphaera italica]
MAKTVPVTKFTELRGLDRISIITHEMNCIFRTISQDDFGIDGEIEVVTPKADGCGLETSGGIIKVQAKSGSSYIKKDHGPTFATPVRIDDLEYWNRCTFPVFFIVYYPKEDALYYKEIKTYIRETSDIWKKPLEVVFNKATDQFTSDVKKSVCDHAAVSPPRISFDQKERLYSNLLPVRQLPKTLTFAKTRRKLASRIKQEIEGYKPPFCIHDGYLYTLSDLYNENNMLRKFCDEKTIDEMPFNDWLDDFDLRKNLVFMINQLFGSHCHRCGLAYNRDFKRTYFPREPRRDADKTFTRMWTSPRTKRDAPPRTVVKFYEYGTFKFWRHLAAEFRFEQFSQKWFLRITPKLLYTDDGKKVCDPKLVGPYTTRMKAMEHNPQVLNHILFWGQTLTNGRQQIELTLYGKTLVVIEPEPATVIADFAIPYDPATYEEEPMSPQLTLFGTEGLEDESDEY